MLLFNWCGYQLLNAYLENRSFLQLRVKLDGNNYSESELISLKVPAANLSYYNCSKQFIRVDGQIEVGGIQYNYVKRRLFNDSIEMICIPNHEATHLNKIKNDFFNLVNDLQHPGQNKKTDSHSNKSFSGDDCIVNALLKIEHQVFGASLKSVADALKLPRRSSFPEEQPPQKNV
jgi:hypothetical protein